MRKPKPEQATSKRHPPPYRAWRADELKSENKRIVTRYSEAIDDATRDAKGGQPTQKQINDRYNF